MAAKTAKPEKPAKATGNKMVHPEAQPKRDAGDQQVFDQGREARASSIDRDSSPHVAGPRRDLWLDGWDYEDKLRA